MSDATQTEVSFQMPMPGPQHEMLKPFEGTFDAEVKIWMGPGDPQVSTGTMTNTFQLNGLFLEQVYVGDATEEFPGFAGRGFFGYNSVKSIFEGFWIDIASDQMQIESGSVDESGRVWEMTSEITCPGHGPMKRRSVLTVIDNDHHRVEAFFSVEGQPESKSMEISYARRS